MENASKALIIAGAIILSVLLISLGILVFRQASDTVTDNPMEEIEITNFNAKFEQFAGDNVSNSTITNIFSTVNASNAKNDNKVNIKYYPNGTGDASTANSTEKGDLTLGTIITSGTNYKVTVSWNDSTGYVECINIYKK